jgi:uncharacterized membrane protein
LICANTLGNTTTKTENISMSLNRTTLTGAALAVAAASLAGCMSTGGSTPVASASSDVKCYGVNKCAGHNDCKTATNACKGQASCKGLGFIKIPAAACDHVGGTVKS